MEDHDKIYRRIRVVSTAKKISGGLALAFLLALFVLAPVSLNNDIATAQVVSNQTGFLSIGWPEIGSSSFKVFFFSWSIVGLLLSSISVVALGRYNTSLNGAILGYADGRQFIKSPPEALQDFMNLALKVKDDVPADNLIAQVQELNEKYVEKYPFFSGVSFILDSNSGSVNVLLNGDLEWKDLEIMFKTYLEEMGIEKQRFVERAQGMKMFEVASLVKKPNL